MVWAMLPCRCLVGVVQRVSTYRLRTTPYGRSTAMSKLPSFCTLRTGGLPQEVLQHIMSVTQLCACRSDHRLGPAMQGF